MRVKQKSIETPAQRILEASDTLDVASSKKVSPKKQRTIFPLRYESDGLLLRGLKPMLVDASGDSRKHKAFFREQCKGDIERIRRELKYRLEKDDLYKDKLIELYVELNNDYFDGPVYIDGLLEKRFDSAKDDTERKVILDMLMIGGDGYSNFIDRVLKNGEQDKRYKFCFEYLKTLDQEAKEFFILSAWCDSNSKKTKNLVKAMTAVFGEDYIISVINNYVKESLGDSNDPNDNAGDIDDPGFFGNVSLMEEDESDYKISNMSGEDPQAKLQAYFNGLEEVANRQRLLLAVLKNSEKQRIGELIVLFNTAVSWKLIRDSVETAVKSAKGNKEQLSEFFLEIAKNSSGNMEPAPVAYGLNAYAYLNKEKAPQVLKEIVLGLDEPTVAHSFVYSMLSLCGKEGEKAIRDVIKSDVKENRKSPVLFFLFGLAEIDSQNNKTDMRDEQGAQEESEEEIAKKKEVARVARKIIREVFAMDEDIAAFIKMNVERKTGVVREHHHEWIISELIQPALMDLVNCIDINRYAEWMMYSKNPNIRDNTRNLFARSLLEQDEFESRTKQKHALIKSLEGFILDGQKKKNKISIDFVKRFAGSI